MENNYKTIKLEKGMYKDKNKSFSEILEELDPSENYASTPLANLDAFERQLKRFNIKVNGKNSDTIEKFFSTKDSQALFPEYISRSINSGITEENNLKHVIAKTIKIDNLNYKNLTIQKPDTSTFLEEISEGTQIPELKLGLKENAIKLKKIGRRLTCSYETLQYQKIAAFNIALKQIGKTFNEILFKDAIKTIIEGNGEDTKATIVNLKQKVNYKTLIEIWTKLKPYNLTTLIISPDAFQKMLMIPEFLTAKSVIDFQTTGNLKTALGANVIYEDSLKGCYFIGIDKNFALNQIISQELKIESDKIIDKQLNTSVITMRYAFAKLFKEACVCMTVQE